MVMVVVVVVVAGGSDGNDSGGGGNSGTSAVVVAAACICTWLRSIGKKCPNCCSQILLSRAFCFRHTIDRDGT